MEGLKAFGLQEKGAVDLEAIGLDDTFPSNWMLLVAIDQKMRSKKEILFFLNQSFCTVSSRCVEVGFLTIYPRFPQNIEKYDHQQHLPIERQKKSKQQRCSSPSYNTSS